MAVLISRDGAFLVEIRCIAFRVHAVVLLADAAFGHAFGGAGALPKEADGLTSIKERRNGVGGCESQGRWEGTAEDCDEW